MQYGESFVDVELSTYKWVSHVDRLRVLAEGGDVFPVTVELDLSIRATTIGGGVSTLYIEGTSWKGRLCHSSSAS